MARLVIQNQGMTGRACELLTDRTTIGRVEDNTFQIADASVSSHHCEIHLRGNEIIIRDLNSTNGTFINNEKIAEKSLVPGQTLRLGQVELKLELEGLSTPGHHRQRARRTAKTSGCHRGYPARRQFGSIGTKRSHGRV
ncbi:MAG: FHA domain-containing protein [Limisphaerales bacterium]